MRFTSIVNNEKVVAVYAAFVTFLTYAAVYAFRKPFTISTYADAPSILGLPYKDALVISQVLGYMLSKFYGIRFIAQLKKSGRGKMVVLLIVIAWVALFFFAIVPKPYNIIFLFLNGFPLGIIWGIVFSFVEGRKATDFIGAALAVSFIFSSGFVKTIAQWLSIHFSISEWWLPFYTGLIFFVPIVLFVFLLERIPPPSGNDIASRTERPVMNKGERKEFFKRFQTGLVLLITIYVFLTIFRDIRDNFMADMLAELGFSNHPELFTNTEAPTAISVLILISLMVLVRNNWRAFSFSHIIIVAGFILSGGVTFLFVKGWISPVLWMTLVGLGLYMGYIPFNCILFDRLIATFKSAGNVGFLMYMADSFGYMGSVGVLLLKSLFQIHARWTDIYSTGVLSLSVLGIIGSYLSFIYFKGRYKEKVANEL